MVFAYHCELKSAFWEERHWDWFRAVRCCIPAGNREQFSLLLSATCGLRGQKNKVPSAFCKQFRLFGRFVWVHIYVFGSKPVYICVHVCVYIYENLVRSRISKMKMKSTDNSWSNHVPEDEAAFNFSSSMGFCTVHFVASSIAFQSYLNACSWKSAARASELYSLANELFVWRGICTSLIWAWQQQWSHLLWLWDCRHVPGLTISVHLGETSSCLQGFETDSSLGLSEDLQNWDPAEIFGAASPPRLRKTQLRRAGKKEKSLEEQEQVGQLSKLVVQGCCSAA